MTASTESKRYVRTSILRTFGFIFTMTGLVLTIYGILGSRNKCVYCGFSSDRGVPRHFHPLERDHRRHPPPPTERELGRRLSHQLKGILEDVNHYHPLSSPENLKVIVPVAVNEWNEEINLGWMTDLVENQLKERYLWATLTATITILIRLKTN